MRVVLTTESFLPYLSGVTVSVDALARGLALAATRSVLAPRPAGAGSRRGRLPGPEPRYAWLPSYQLSGIVPPRYRMPWPAPWSRALDEARRFGPGVVHANSPFVGSLVARGLARTSVCRSSSRITRFADYGHYLGPLPGRARG